MAVEPALKCLHLTPALEMDFEEMQRELQETGAIFRECQNSYHRAGRVN